MLDYLFNISIIFHIYFRLVIEIFKTEITIVSETSVEAFSEAKKFNFILFGFKLNIYLTLLLFNF